MLTSKCQNPKSIKEFWPISLCNMGMKLVLKMMANRVKHILPYIIDVEKSAFVKGRLIIDNALISMECYHWMEKRTEVKKWVMALKLDMSKAYNKVE